jgi:GNAT superfamily N-acetyltransferase
MTGSYALQRQQRGASHKVVHIVSFKDRLLAPYNGLKVDWFDGWHPILDEALQSLPEMETCPHELFRLLIENPGPARKRSALVTERGVPVAVVGLRQRGRYSWEPVTQWITPGAVFPAKPGYLMSALESLRIEVWVAWWRMASPPPASQLMRYLESTPTYRLSCSGDCERYWRETGHFKTIRRIRNRCRNYTLAINAPGSAEWTIRNWEAKWRPDPATVDPSLTDRIIAANYLEGQGRYYTLTLLDGDVRIGGATMTVHHGDAVAGVLHRDLEYRRQGVGDRLIDLSFTFAAERGFETFDIGGGHHYKSHWARQEGERWWFNICPEPLYGVKQTLNWARRLRGKASSEAEQQRPAV